MWPRQKHYGNLLERGINESILILSKDKQSSPCGPLQPDPHVCLAGVKYHAQPFLFSFTRLPRQQQPSPTPSCIPGPRMVYASNLHQLPPVPHTVDLIHLLAEAVFAVVCYAWLTFCCFFVAPCYEDPRTNTPSESPDHYLHRIWLPQSHVANYLLPLISSVSTCPHEGLLCFSRPPMSWTTSLAPIASSIT